MPGKQGFASMDREKVREIGAKGGGTKTTMLKGFAAMRESNPDKFKELSSKGGQATWNKIKGVENEQV